MKKYNNKNNNNISSQEQWVAGIHAVSVALDEKTDIAEVYFDPERKNQRLDKLVSRITKDKISIIKAKSDVINKSCGTDHHQGVCARVLTPAVLDEGEFWDRFNESNLADNPNALLLILD